MSDDDMKWMRQAKCNGMSNEIFFPTPKKNKVNPAQYKVALAVCAACPVQKECLAYALKFRMIHDGIFGGKMPHQRRVMLSRAARNSKA